MSSGEQFAFVAITWVICAAIVLLMFRGASRESQVNYCTQPDLLPKDRGDMTPSMRLHHIWQRSLMIHDEQMAIFEEACELMGVDSSQDTQERAIVEEVFLYRNSGLTPGIATVHLANLREKASQ
jgi:hypothetical protein